MISISKLSQIAAHRRIFIAITLLLQIPTLEAGDALLYSNSKCSSSYGPTRIATYNSVACTKAPTSLGSPVLYGISTGRNIGPTCEFFFYEDSKCLRLAHSIHSNGPQERCLPVKHGILSYKIKCSRRLSKKPLNPPKKVSDLQDAAGVIWYTPLTQYRGKKSGGTNIEGPFVDFGGEKSYKPSGSPAMAGYKLAKTYASKVPNRGSKIKVSASEGGTIYSVQVTGDRSNGYTAEKVIATLGESGLASLFADGVASLMKYPRTYWFFETSNYDKGDENFADFNFTYVTPR